MMDKAINGSADSKRTRVFFCSMKYRPLDNPAAQGIGFINSVFPGGMCISTAGPLRESEILEADFNLPGIERNVVADLRVAWVKNWTAGLEFMRRKNHDGADGTAFLSSYIDSISHTNLQSYYQQIQNDFVYRLAEDDEDRERIYRLRYLIYVLEHHWEPAHESGLERDEYDARSIHFLVQDKNRAVIAASRMLPGSQGELPIQKYFRVDTTHGNRFLPSEVCEVSRFCVAREYRRHIEEPHDADDPVDLFPTEGPVTNRFKYRSSSLLMNFFKFMVHYSLDHGIRAWYMVSEKRLANTLSETGVDLIQLGPPQDYHGMRTPYLLFTEKLVREPAHTNPGFSDLLYSEQRLQSGTTSLSADGGAR